MVKITKEIEVAGYTIRKYSSPGVEVELFKKGNRFEPVESREFETLQKAFDYVSSIGFK